MGKRGKKPEVDVNGSEHDPHKPHRGVRVFAVVFVAFAAALSVANIGLAYSINSTVSNEKQLLADGNMEAASTGSWSAGAGATITKETTSPHSGSRVLRLADNGASANIWTAQNPVVTTGKTYRITGWARTDGINSSPRVRDAASFVWVGINSTSWQRFDVTFVSAGTIVYFYAADGNTGSYVEFDDVFITEYVGKTQGGEKQVLADGNMEASGTTDWTARNSAVLSKEVVGPASGNRLLRITGGGVANPGARQTGKLLNSKRYCVTGKARGDGTAVPRVSLGGDAVTWTGTSSNSWQNIEACRTMASIGSWLYVDLYQADATGYSEYDDILITEYLGSSNGTESQIIIDGNMEASGTSSWTSYNSTLSKQTSNPNSGSRVIRITRTGTSASASQTVLTPGKTYRLKAKARGDGTNAPSVYEWNVASPATPGTLIWQGTNSTSWQTVDLVFLASKVSLGIFSTSVIGNYSEFDDVFLTLVQ